MRAVLDPVFKGQLDLLNTAEEREAYILSVLTNRSCSPLKWQEFTSRNFVQWLLSLRKHNGKPPGFGTLAGHRSALFNLYRDFKVTRSSELESGLQGHFKGLKRTTARAAQAGAAPVKPPGKDPLSFGMYVFLCKQFLMRGKSSEFISAQCIITLSWSLMCRISNSIDVKHTHIEWSEDALTVYWAWMKNDQAGENPRDPRHVYANPLQPEICPILALGMYWLCFEFSTESNKLFPGSKQDDRFNTTLGRVLESPAGKEELERRGLSASDLGSHSVRKGGTTYVSSGTTAAPSQSAICIRGGWSQGKVRDIYMRWEAAGDQYTGRTLSGLPTLSGDFGILPPFFSSSTPPELIKKVLGIGFLNLPDRLTRIAEFCLASLVFHRQWLIDNLPVNHRIFTTTLFRDPAMLIQLRDYVLCRPEKVGDPIRASGIPPHTVMIQKLDQVLKRLETVEERLGDVVDILPPRLRDIVVKELEDRAMVAGTITRDGMRQLLDDIGLPEVVARLGRLEQGGIPPPLPAPAASDAASGPTSQPTMFMWGGKFRRLPESFEFPSMTALSAWQLWCCGDASQRLPPFKQVEEVDFARKNARKRLSDLRLLMHAIDDQAKKADGWVQNPSTEQANEMYKKAMPALALFPEVSIFTLNVT